MSGFFGVHVEAPVVDSGFGVLDGTSVMPSTPCFTFAQKNPSDSPLSKEATDPDDRQR